MSRPTNRAVAIEAAKYVAIEFTSFASWRGYEEELADEWLSMPAQPGNFSFSCAIDYVVPKVVSMIKWNTGMQNYAKHRGDPVAVVAGHVLGEWAAGNQSLDRALGDW
jgi:hypothetical protein